jgi:hypothetical protein
MRTVLKRQDALLRMAFGLAETNVPHLDAAATKRLKGEVLEFLGASDKGAHPSDTCGVYFAAGLGPDSRISTAELQDLQIAVKRLLDAVPSGLYRDVPSLDLMFAPMRVGANLRIDVVKASVLHRYLLELLLVLTQVGAGRIRVCPVAGCGGAYLKVGKRASCHRAECRAVRRARYTAQRKGTPADIRARKRYYKMVGKGWKFGARAKRRAIAKNP